MPELQALNSIKDIVGLGAGAMMLTVIIAMFIFLKSQDKIRANAESLDAQAAARMQDLLQQIFSSLNKAQENKEELDRLGDGQDSAVVVMQNIQTLFNPLPSLIRGMSDGMETFQQALSQVKELNITASQHITDFMVDQERRFDSVDEKVDSIMDTNMRLVLLLERLNANLERLNMSLETLSGVSTDIQEIKGAIMNTVTSEQTAEIVEPDENADVS